MEKIEEYLNEHMPYIVSKGDGLYEIRSKSAGLIDVVGKRTARVAGDIIKAQTKKALLGVRNIRF